MRENEGWETIANEGIRLADEWRRLYKREAKTCNRIVVVSGIACIICLSLGILMGLALGG